AAGDTLWIVPTGGLIDRGAVVAEIDGDPGLEVVFGSSDASLYVVNGEDGSGVWEFFAGPGYAIENAPIVEDFDEDGWVDIFFIGGHGTSDTVPNFGRAYAIKSGPGNGDVWTMYRHDPYRTGYLLGGPVTCINEHPVTPATFSIQTWPNPFNGSVTIIMNIINELSPRLRIISLNGEEIINEELKSGYFIWLPDPQLSSGIYLVNAQMGKEKVTGKIVYIK
ncbi:T9SS type A sorting domain-containing protein, partial [bacterium]|nr:T9SS type A sorting domain-containing protein [bacterium]